MAKTNCKNVNPNRFFFLIFLLIAFICGCHQPKMDLITVEANIVKNSVYKRLDKEKDTREFGLDIVQPPKTSDVRYRNNRNHSLNDTTYSRMYNCKSYINKGGLRINIGIGNGFVSEGFFINCKDPQFNVKLYYETDAIVEGQPEPIFTTIDQKLILNKSHYALGDSVFGRVTFKVVEENNGQKITHIGDGYFRCKVVKDP